MTADSSPEHGVIGRAYEEGLPVIYAFTPALPPQAQRAALGWLAVLAWPYDGAAHNGMPQAPDNQQMMDLEDAIAALDGALGGAPSSLYHAYSRTGNHLKELVYYVQRPDAFLEALNAALRAHPPYPLDIRFYEDGDWSDLHKLIQDFAPRTADAQPSA